MDSNVPVYLGIDGGGSKCRAIVTNADMEIIGTALAGPANPFHGYEAAIQSVVDASIGALRDAGFDAEHLCNLTAGVGLAGVNLPYLFERVSNWNHPFKSMHLTTDLHIASLGAHQGKDGAVIICGTGSCGYSWIKEQSRLVGGHGFPHGDKGSGAWLGLQIIEHVLEAMDEIAEPTSLVDAVLSQVDCEDDLGLVEKVAKFTPAQYGQLGNLAFDHAEKGDAVAIAIVKDGADYISAVGEKLFETDKTETLPLALIGGIAPRLVPFLSPSVSKRIVNAKYAPEIGAVLFAQSHLVAVA